jgi:hypothetical protein
MAPTPLDSVGFLLSLPIKPQEAPNRLLIFKILIVTKHPFRGIIDAIGREDLLADLNPTNKGQCLIVPFIEFLFNPFFNT